MRLIYCAIPSRMYKKSNFIMDYVESERCAPFNPLFAFPLERFEFGSVGREKTMNYCRRLIDLCDEFWYIKERFSMYLIHNVTLT